MANLLKTQGFIPFLSIIFFNAFVDLGHKILLQNTFFVALPASEYTVYSAIINAMILLPYVVLFTPTGFISDRFSKTKVMQVSAAAAVPLTIAITCFYYLGWFWPAFYATLLLATQSAFNSPAKYGLIKEAFGKTNLAKTNAYVQTVVIIAILTGTLAFTVFFSNLLSRAAGHFNPHDFSEVIQQFAPLGFLLIAASLLETFLTLMLPKQKAAAPDSNYELSRMITFDYLKSYLQEAHKNRTIFTCIIGLSLFWAINQVLLATYGAFLKEHLPQVSVTFAQGSLAIAGIGILIGASYAGKISRGFIETGLVPFGAIGSSICLAVIPHLKNETSIILLFLVYGFFGGILIVPLNALIQFHAKKDRLGKLLAANNFLQTVFMLGFLVLTVSFTLIGTDSILTLHGLLGIAIIASIYSIKRLPQALPRYILYLVVSKIYRIRVYGLDHLPSTDGILLLGNHVSFLDWAVLQITSPRLIRFVMDRTFYEKWYLKWLMKKLRMIPISRSGSKQAISDIHAALKAGDVVALFPEGYLSRNGQLGTFQRGFELSAKNSGAVIVPFYIRGLWGTATSLASSRYKSLSTLRTRHVSISYGSPLPCSAKAAEVKSAIFTLSITAWHRFTASLQSIDQIWLEQAIRHGKDFCLRDGSGTEFSHNKLIAAVFSMAKTLKPLIKSEQNIGIILPPGAAGVISNLALLTLGKTLVNLNYTSSPDALSHAIKSADIKTIITAKQFTHKLTAKGFDCSNLDQQAQIIYLDTLDKRRLQFRSAFNLLFIYLLPISVIKLLKLSKRDINDTAAILFSSGSEGSPKGIELSHRNILGNAKQVISVCNIEKEDVILSALPLFHAFGLTVTTFMPLIAGTPLICHPDPTDALAIGQLVATYQVSFLCSTSTFLGVYCRNPKLHPLMFQSLRLVISGAEKLSASVRMNVKDKFGLDVLEGYGATEVSPVASCNMPNLLNITDWHIHTGNKPGTVGLPLPGTAFKIVDPNTMQEVPTGEAGLILIGGTQVMKGYLNNPKKTHDVLIPDGDIIWYKTGDKGQLDADGFLTILDRYARFAKLGGEMVSLSAVETSILEAISDLPMEVLAVAIPDLKKGEQIVLLYTAEINEKTLRDRLMQAKIDSLMLPKSVIKLDALPKLGTGKNDVYAAKQLAIDKDRFRVED